MTKLEIQMNNTSNPNEKVLGEVMLEMYKMNDNIKEIIEGDIEHEDMTLSKCFEKLFDYAKANKTNNCYATAVFKIDAENPVVKIILNFYSLPKSWLEETQKTVSFFDMME